MCQTCTSLGYYEGNCWSPSPCDSGTAVPTQSTAAFSTSPSSAATSWTPPIRLCSSGQTVSQHFGSTLMTSGINSSIERITASDDGKSNWTCNLGDAYCSIRGPGHALDGLNDVCLLWDDACCGNGTAAFDDLWSNDLVNQLLQNKCFVNPSTNCTNNNPVGRMDEFKKLKQWLRSPECFGMFPTVRDRNDAMVIHEDALWKQNCCGECNVAVEKIDVYYWPDPHADRSCLDIIGNGTATTPSGATTNGNGVYWGCTSQAVSEIDVTGSYNVTTVVYFTTATLTTVASYTFMAYLSNPWDASPCTRPGPLEKLDKRTLIPMTLEPRDHSIVVTNTEASTAMLGNYTL